MANLYQKLAFGTQMRFADTTRSALLWVVTLCVILAAPAYYAHADQAPAQLTPYTAKYKTSTRGMNITLTRELKIGSDGNYTLTNGGKLIVAGINEVSVFTVDGTRIVPKSYIYQGTGLINRRREVHFTQGSNTIRSLYKDEWYELPYTDKTMDRMSQQEQVRLFLLNDPTPAEDISIRVADGKRVKDYVLRYVSEDILKTPVGELKTLHFERVHDDPDRKSDMWIAPELDYLMVKTIHIEDGKPVEVLVTEVKIGDKK